MKKVLSLFVIILVCSASYAQTVKIGYTNIELILSYMPETKAMEKKIEGVRNAQYDILREVEAKITQKITEINGLDEDSEIAKIKAGEIEQMLEGLEKIKISGQARLSSIESKIRGPLLVKVQDAIERVRIEKGYSIILSKNQAIDRSPVLAASVELDITNDVLKKLGIEN